MLHYLFWGIDELKTNLRRLHCDVRHQLKLNRKNMIKLEKKTWKEKLINSLGVSGH